MGEDLTRWTIRLALAAYVAALIVRIRTKSVMAGNDTAPANVRLSDAMPGTRGQRGLRTLGCCLAWAHVACAFAFYHHWSHDDAYLRTALQTAEIVGIDWGGGIYFNYLFMLLWTADVAWSWSFPTTYQNRSAKYLAILDTYLAFIAFNATVIFGHGAVRYIGAAATLGLLWLAWSRRRR